MKKYSKAVLGVIIFFMTILVVFFCVKKSIVLNKSERNEDISTISDSSSNSDIQQKLSNSSNEDMISKATHDVQQESSDNSNEDIIDKVTYNIGETCVTEDWEYTVKDVFITKGGSGMTPYPNDNFPCNENGDFTCEYSCIVVDIELTNLSAEERELYMNSSSIELYIYDDSGTVSVDSNMAFPYTYNSNRPVEEKDFYKCTFASGESCSYRIGYKMQDSWLTKKYDIIRLCINHSGMAAFNENIRYYNILENNCPEAISDDKND